MHAGLCVDLDLDVAGLGPLALGNSEVTGLDVKVDHQYLYLK